MRANCRIDHFVVGSFGLSCFSRVYFFGIKKKPCTLVDYAGENLFVNLLPFKCNDTGLDVCMDLKLIKHEISDSTVVRGCSPQMLYPC